MSASYPLRPLLLLAQQDCGLVAGTTDQDVAGCEALDHCFYHLDGKGQIAHLDMLLSLECLHGIQWIPGAGQPPPEAWLPLLKRIRDAGKLCQLYVSPEGARTIVRELGGRGFALAIEWPMPAPDMPQQVSQADAEDFLRVLAGDNGRTRRM